MKKVLIISYAFPPMGLVGAYRPAKFCKFLPRFGWQPVVLTTNKILYGTHDYSLLNELSHSVTIYRSRGFEPLVWWDQRGKTFLKNSLEDNGKTLQVEDESSVLPRRSITKVRKLIRDIISIPDRHNFWIPFAVYTGLRVIRKEKIDVLFSTSPPVSGHLVAYILSFLTGIPLVIDLRDLWTLNPSYDLSHSTIINRAADCFLEKRVISRAKGIITTCQTNTNIMRIYHSFKKKGRFYTITNGLDADDFKDLKFPTKKNSRFTMLYLGNLYGHYNPNFLFDAVDQWFRRRPDIVSSVIIHFIGTPSKYKESVRNPNLRQVLTFSKRIAQHKAIPKLYEADLLLLIVGFNKFFKGIIPAKLFEYVATGLPILAFLPPGEAQQIIIKYQRGIALTCPDIERTCNFLDTQYHKWQASGPNRQPEFFLPPEFDRRKHAEKLAEILNKAYDPIK